MELGKKLRRARLEAGLTQKQLSQGIVTRNMLSLIERGTANPSMDTLMQLSRRLGKNVSYFLEDSAVVSPNTEVMTQVRRLFDQKEYAGAAQMLKQYQVPDPVYDREKELLQVLCYLQLASQALEKGKEGYARELLQKAETETVYCAQDLKRRRLLLRGKLRGERVSESLPGLDEELMLRATEARSTKRAAQLLDACEDWENAQWNLLRGRIWLSEKGYDKAKDCLLMAEKSYPEETASLLEICFRELGDYKRAYEYACKQKA